MQGKINNDRFGYLDLWLLLFWFAIGIVLRSINLADKPASSIEIATLGFSLGNGFSQIPLDRLMSASTLLSPLKLDPTINSADVIDRLFAESTHPPLYFWLTHWWIELFTDNNELVDLQVGRSLSAIFGGLSIPAIFGLSWLTFCDRNLISPFNRRRLTAHLAAILMALSPYGIYLAQEARHYTLSILWIIASVSCLIATLKRLYHRCRIPWWMSLVWIIINSLGIATHYFFSLTLILEGFVIVCFWFWQRIDSKDKITLNSWFPIIIVGLGTLAGCLVWLPVASNISSNELTDWIETDYDLDEILLPIPRTLAWLITMVVLLPIEGVPKAIAICLVVIILLGLAGIFPALTRGYKSLRNSSQGFSAMLLTSYLLGAVILYLALIYGYGKDVSLAARYHFVYFPVIILMLAAIFTHLWDSASIKQSADIKNKRFFLEGKKVVAAVLIMSFLGSLTVVNDFGYQKSRHANSLAAHIQTSSTVPVIVATTYETLSELRELVALALAFETNDLSNEAETQFVLVRRNQQHDSNLNTILSSQTRPFDLWGINLRDNESNLNTINCIKDNEAKLSDAGYKNRVYHCN